MKIFNIKQSLPNKVLGLLGLCFLVFMAGTGFSFYFQKKALHEYIESREMIEGKLKVANQIYNHFNSYLLATPNSLTIRVPTSEEELLYQEKELTQKLNEFNELIQTNDDAVIYQNMNSFMEYYFAEVIPSLMKEYEQNHDPSVEISNETVYKKMELSLQQLSSIVPQLEEDLTENAVKFAERESAIQNILIAFLIIFLVFLTISIRRIFRSIVKPLAEFTHSANEIAAGRDAVVHVDSNRKDELGTLSIAFQKMVNSIQDKEQDLVAHNEELIAQQEELQAQQQELEATLEILTENQHQLLQRNQLINGISPSLNKGEVLLSIVVSMCNITRSVKGIITYLYEDSFAAYGISDQGVSQFRSNLNNGLIERLTDEKKVFTIKREQVNSEKGYHETSQYSYDLYVPVISNLQVIAVMVFTRYGEVFLQNELSEYETLSKQIAIYLEKINLFEQSENDRRLNQDILNTVQEGIQLIDKDRKIIKANKQLLEIFKLSNPAEEAFGVPWDQWSDFMAGQIQEDEFVETLDELINSAIHSPNEEHSFIYRKKEWNQVIKIYCKMLQTSNDHFGTLLVHRDITKEYEIAQMKSELVSTVSHELRTPLASVLGFTELLLNKELKPERKTKYLQTIFNEAKRLTDLINDFLDIQRMESGKQTYEKKFMDITPILKNVIELQEINMSSKHNISLSIELEEKIILGDRMKIEQVFTNLLSNAIKYSPNGGNIYIRVYDSNDMMSVDIKDEGLGIPEQEIPHIFQQFYRVDNSDRRRIGGTGLGLAIVQEIVKAHGGVISVNSEFEKGSTFIVQFPHVLMKANKQDEAENDSISRYTVMVIEDDISLAELLNHELKDSGFHVVYHNSGKTALKEMKFKAPDAIVLDIMLEDEVDGWTIMKEMKKSTDLKNIPIFISTAIDDKEQAFSLGAQEYLVKPYKPSQLSNLIINTLFSDKNTG